MDTNRVPEENQIWFKCDDKEKHSEQWEHRDSAKGMWQLTPEFTLTKSPWGNS